MKILTICLALFLLSFTGKDKALLQVVHISFADSLPVQLKGNFMDDYGIRYTVNDSVWIQHSKIKYHIIRHNSKEQFLIARNDDLNPSEGGLYTRIDYMSFTGMAPYEWGFCLTVYNAKTDSLAETTAEANRLNPKKGCNGFPFSRMKRVEK